MWFDFCFPSRVTQDDIEEEEGETTGEQKPTPWADNGTEQPITSQPTQPDPWGDKPTVIAMPPPAYGGSASETTNLTNSYHSTYQ